MKRKVLSILLVGILIVGLTGCGSSSKKESNSTNTTSNDNDSTIKNVVTCIGVQKSENGMITGRKAIFEDNKIIKIVDFANAKNQNDAEKHCNLFNKIDSKYTTVSIEIKENNCNVTYDISKMSDGNLEDLSFRNRNNQRLYNDMSYNDYYDYASSDSFHFCFKGDEEQMKYASKFSGNYEGFIYASNGGTYDWHKVTMSFNDGNYVCSYSINNNNYKIVGSYTYDLDDGKLELNMDEKNSEGNTNLASSCYGTKRVYENIEGYNIEIVNTVSDNTDYQKGLKLNKE